MARSTYDGVTPRAPLLARRIPKRVRAFWEGLAFIQVRRAKSRAAHRATGRLHRALLRGDCSGATQALAQGANLAAEWPVARVRAWDHVKQWERQSAWETWLQAYKAAYADAPTPPTSMDVRTEAQTHLWTLLATLVDAHRHAMATLHPRKGWFARFALQRGFEAVLSSSEVPLVHLQALAAAYPDLWPTSPLSFSWIIERASAEMAYAYHGYDTENPAHLDRLQWLKGYWNTTRDWAEVRAHLNPQALANQAGTAALVDFWLAEGASLDALKLGTQYPLSTTGELRRWDLWQQAGKPLPAWNALAPLTRTVWFTRSHADARLSHQDYADVTLPWLLLFWADPPAGLIAHVRDTWEAQDWTALPSTLLGTPTYKANDLPTHIPTVWWIAQHINRTRHGTDKPDSVDVQWENRLVARYAQKDWDRKGPDGQSALDHLRASGRHLALTTGFCKADILAQAAHATAAPASRARARG